MATDAVNEITQRFCIAVERSFAFLVSDFGFSYGGCQLIDADDVRGQTVVGRFFKGARRIEVRINVIALTVSVFSSRYATATDCLSDAVPADVLNLETTCPNTEAQARPRWMKHTTLRAEALAGFKRYGKLMKQNLEEGVEFLGERLRACAAEMGLH